MFKQIFVIKKRREEDAVSAERQARLELEQAAAALRAEIQRKSDYEEWAVLERERLYAELQQQDAVKYNDLMQWNAQVADVKQGLLSIEEQIITLEQTRAQKKSAYEQAVKQRQAAEQQAIRFEELVKDEERAAMLEQQRVEESEMEDFRRPTDLF